MFLGCILSISILWQIPSYGSHADLTIRIPMEVHFGQQLVLHVLDWGPCPSLKRLFFALNNVVLCGTTTKDVTFSFSCP